MKRLIAAFLPSRHGGIAVEFALIAPLLAFMIMLMAETGMLIMDYRRLSVAVEAAADFMEANPNAPFDEIESTASQAFHTQAVEGFFAKAYCLSGETSGVVAIEAV